MKIERGKRERKLKGIWKLLTIKREKTKERKNRQTEENYKVKTKVLALSNIS
jgi:hypothetical protein